MFYSSTFLCRKGSLGTVWIAAHLQNRLKKSQYTSFPIPQTVEEIMCPPVPIALRLSGHLLLGIARIYSKKVEYLFEDCNSVLSSLIKVFSSIEINLPENARYAPFYSITLPETFNLDAFDLEDDIYYDKSPDKNIRSPKEITLPDNVPVEQEPYIAINFDEDYSVDTSQLESFPDLGDRSMKEDDNGVSPNSRQGNMYFQDCDLSNHKQATVPPPNLADCNVGVEDSGPTDQIEAFSNHAVQTQSNFGSKAPEQSIHMEVTSVNVPEIEVLRNASDDISSEQLHLVLSDHGNDKTEDSRVLNENSTARTNSTPLVDNITDSEGHSLPFQLQSETPAYDASREAPDTMTTYELLRHVPDELAIRTTPPVRKPSLSQSQRKRKNQYFDEPTVLSNKFLKKTLRNCKDIMRIRRNMPHDSLGEWKLCNLVKKEEIFLEPSIIGLSADLRNAFSKEVIASRKHLVVEPAPEPSIPRAPLSERFQEHVPISSPFLTAEVAAELHNVVNHAHVDRTSPYLAKVPSSSPATEAFGETIGTHFCYPHTECSSRAQVSEPPAATPEASIDIERIRCNEEPCCSNMLFGFITSGSDNSTPMSDNLKSVSESQLGATVIGMQSTSDFASSTGTCGSALKTPITCLFEQWGSDALGISGIPEFKSADSEDLTFLETDNSQPSASQGSPDVGGFSPRTRSVAKYLKRRSPTMPSGDLSLKKILEGRVRKMCARMFYETLVLKSHGLVDIKQDETYGDIALRLTPQLSKFKI